MKRKSLIAIITILAVLISVPDAGIAYAAQDTAEDSVSPAFDSTAWLYNSSNDVYYQYGVVYCNDPDDTTYESLGIYVPAAYMEMESNGDGTYTFVGFTESSVNGYTADTAPVVMPVNTSGYSAQSAPTGYSSDSSEYTAEGFIYLYAGCRGRTTADGGAPWGATDLKAAIRFYRLHADVLPGNTDAIFTFGHSGGGAQSAVVGASGDSELYYPYLYSIGAAGIEYDETTGIYSSTISDAICGAMCWCPITSLDYADEAYEWMMGQYDTSGSTRQDGTWTAALSDDMSVAFASYINSLTLTDESGNALTLSSSDDGIYASGSYCDYLLYQIEYSLNDFIDSYTDSDGNFSYTGSSGNSGSSGDIGNVPDDLPGDSSGGPGGGIINTPFSLVDSETETASESADTDELTTYLLSIDENYGTDDAWITYDETTGWYSVRSIEDFVLYGSKSASKSVGAFDDLDLGQAENAVFGSGSTESAHFDSVMAALLTENYSSYAAQDSSVSESEILAYAQDYTSDYTSYTDSLGFSSQYRQNMYNPMYYLCEDYEGYGTSNAASYWRINTGITQSDTSLTVEVNLYLALCEAINDGTVQDVDFAMYWEQGHTTAERAGADSDECFREWVEECVADLASSDDSTTDDETTDDGSTDEDGGSADDELTDDGSTDDGSADDGLVDDGTVDDGTSNGGTTDDDTTDDGSTGDGLTDDGTTDNDSTDDGTTNDDSTDDGTADDESGDSGESSTEELSSSRVTLSSTSYTYNGSARKPSVIVTNSTGTVLTEGTDYTVAYASGRKDVGTYKVKITGTGNYTGTVTKTFTIKAQTLSSSRVSLSKTSYTYNGSARKPSVTVTNSSGTTLTKGTDYTVTYASGRKNVGTYKVTITGTGNYTGTVTKTFTIKAQTLSSSRVSLSKTSYTYNGSARKPSVTAKNSSGTTLTKGTDYTVTYASGRKNVGTYKVTITGTGNYTGTVTKTFKIKAQALSSSRVSLSKTSYTYNGSARKPSVTVTNSSGTTLTKDTDYTVSYASGRKSIGTYKVKITGTGNYTGTITKTFTINPGKTTISSAKSSSAKKLTVKWKKVSGSVKYQIAYKKKGSSVWTYKTVSASTYSKTLSSLTSGKTYYVKVRAYKKVSGKTYYGSWSSTKTVKVK